MCLRTLAPLLGLALLPGCINSGYLVTSLAADPTAIAQSPAAQVTASRYTSHPPAATVQETVTLRIAGPFDLDDRARILRAVNEWNVALNGFVRLAIVDDSAPGASQRQPRPWTIMTANGIGPRATPGSTIALAHTQAVPGTGGLMIVYRDRIGMRDLGSVIMHELGHVLGLGHGPKGLMAAHYHPTDQQCVDKATIADVAAQRRLPISQLNWCHANVQSAAR
jgi:hypothetical protein